MKGRCPYCKKDRMKLFDEISDKAVKIAKEITNRSFSAPQNERDRIIFLSGAGQILSEYIWQEHESLCKLKKYQKQD